MQKGRAGRHDEERKERVSAKDAKNEHHDGLYSYKKLEVQQNISDF